MWKENRKFDNNSVYLSLLAYMFTKCGWGRLSSDGDRRASLCGERICDF